MMLLELIKDSFDFIFPSSCELCGKMSTNSDLICNQCNPKNNKSLWLDYLKFDSDNEKQIIFSCLKCQEQTSNILLASAVCPICQISPLPVNKVRSIWHYKEEIEDLIKKYKYHSRIALADYFADVACKEIISKQLLSPGFPDVIVPIPSSKNILRKREFSHTYLVAKKIAAYFEIPCYPLLLKSRKTRRAQAKLSPEKRAKNMQNAFSVNNTLLQGKRILLFDDVLTTGSSISSAANALIKTNCSQIDVLTLARSANFSKNRILASLLKA